MTTQLQALLEEKKRLLDQINSAILAYDPVLREKARDLLLAEVFGQSGLTETPTNGHAHLCVSSPIDTISVTRLKDLIDRWSPENQANRALLSAYHLQNVVGHRRITGRQIQKNLKKLGLRLANVTVATNQNATIVPPRMKKMSRKGKRNYYVVTPSGVKYVENKLNGVEDEW